MTTINDFTVGETAIIVQGFADLYRVTVLSVGKKNVKVRVPAGWGAERDIRVPIEKIAKLHEKTVVLCVKNDRSRYGQFTFDREKYPQYHHEASKLLSQEFIEEYNGELQPVTSDLVYVKRDYPF